MRVNFCDFFSFSSFLDEFIVCWRGHVKEIWVHEMGYVLFIRCYQVFIITNEERSVGYELTSTGFIFKFKSDER